MATTSQRPMISTGSAINSHRSTWLRSAAISVAAITTAAGYFGLKAAMTDMSHSLLMLAWGGGIAAGAVVSVAMCGNAERDGERSDVLVFWRAMADFGLVSGALCIGFSAAVGASGDRRALLVVLAGLLFWFAATGVLAFLHVHLRGQREGKVE